MKRYRCHKIVEAAQIRAIEDHLVEGKQYINVGVGELVTVTPEWMIKHRPQIGGYFVRYADGYTSYSPAQAFEEGYTEMSRDSELIRTFWREVLKVPVPDGHGLDVTLHPALLEAVRREQVRTTHDSPTLIDEPVIRIAPLE